MIQPVRLQYRRAVPLCSPGGLEIVYVGRPSPWGNPYKVFGGRTPAEAVALFEADLLAGRLGVTVNDVVRELRGKHLACYCKIGDPCHGDVLLRIANEEASDGKG